MLSRPALFVPTLLVALGCGEAAAPMTPDAAPAGCTADADCFDGVFCNGVERCEPESASADAEGCVEARLAPCPSDVACNETLGTCGAACDVDADQDGDGFESRECGGSDCDDFDASRFPGNAEVCDAEGRDEDCDPSTLGDDADDDGFVDAACCNRDAAGRLQCGTDCNDALSGVNPGTPETCNEVDDDCDGLVDDGLTQLFFEDRDGDGFGVESTIVRACTRPEGFAFFPGDCDDTNPTTSPAGLELCDGVDSNCSSGGGEDLAEDADGDGFAPAGVDFCVPLEPEPDCEDTDARAFPGQREFFAVPVCDEGRRACRCTQTFACLVDTEVHQSFFCIPEAESCGPVTQECFDYPDAVRGRWDFDCDGVELRAPDVEPGVCFRQDPGACEEGNGFDHPTGCVPAQCGDDALRIECELLSGCFDAPLADDILPCR